MAQRNVSGEDVSPKSAAASRKEREQFIARGEDGLAISGLTKAVLWVLSVDEALAVETLSKLSESEVRRLRQAIDGIDKASMQYVPQVHADFQATLDRQPLRYHGSAEYLEGLTMRAFGEARAATLLNLRTRDKGETNPLSHADVDILAPLLSQEHPQVVAAVTASLPSSRSAEILKRLPDAMRKNVILRLARMTRIPGSALNDAESVLSANLPSSNSREYDLDGIRITATVLNELDPQVTEQILSEMGQSDERLASDVRRAMFTFEDLIRVDKISLQQLIKSVEDEKLLLALKVASSALREKIFSCLSRRAAETLREDFNILGAVRLADVEAAQSAIVVTALQLREQGKVKIPSRGDEDYV